MKPSYGIVLTVLAAVGAGRLDAQSPGMPRLPLVPPPPEAVPQPLPSPTPLPMPGHARTAPPTGRFALLKDQRLLEGEVFLGPENITVRRGAIENTFPKPEVLFIGANREEVYEYQRKFVGPMDIDGRLKLAKWCAFSGMREHALAEARAVVSLDPTNAAASSMARLLEESLRKYPPPGVKAAPDTIPPSSSRPEVAAPQPVAGTPISIGEFPALPISPSSPMPAPIVKVISPEPPMAAPVSSVTPTPVVAMPVSIVKSPTRVEPPLGVSAKAVSPATPTPVAAKTHIPVSVSAAFRTKVQPVLTNLCASCHSQPKITGYKLARIPEWDANPALVENNMKVTMAHVRNENPSSSPFLVIALARHGGMREPAFASERVPAYRALVEWVQMASPFVPPAPRPANDPLAMPNGPASLLPMMPKVMERSPAIVRDVPPLPPISTPPMPPVAPKSTPPVPAPATKLPSVPPPPGISVAPSKDMVFPIVGITLPGESGVTEASAKTAPKAMMPTVPQPPAFAADKKPEVPTGPNPMNIGAPADEFDPSLFNRVAHPPTGPEKKSIP